MSSANAFNLDQSKSLSSGNELTHYFLPNDKTIDCPNVKCLLDTLGFSGVFDIFSHLSVKSFQTIFKQCMLDCFVQEWYGALDKSAVLAKYKNFEPFFSYECYLDVVPYGIRFHLTRLRLSVHSLRIQTGKFGQNRIPRNESFCTLCELNEIEDTYHFTCVCPRFVTITVKYLKTSFVRKPSLYKLCQLFQSTDKETLCGFARFLKEAFFLRNKLQSEIKDLV